MKISIIQKEQQISSAIIFVPLVTRPKKKIYTVFTRKSAYAQKSAPLELAPPFENQKLNERLPHISAPLFPLKRRSFETDLLLKGHSIGIRSKTLIHGLAIFLC